MRGCEALVPAGSVYSQDSRDAARIRQVNVRGTDLVLGDGSPGWAGPNRVRLQHRRLATHRRPDLTPDSPPGHPPGPYLGSKADAERVARRHQQAGAPVVITYPGAVLGPHDLHLGDQLQRLRIILKGRYPIAPSGGYATVDVRDVAAVTPRSLSPAGGPAAT